MADRLTQMQAGALKLLMIGDSVSQKTQLLRRFANDSFSQTFITTIGIDFKIKYVTVGSKRIKLQIWDTAGQERFRTITTSYFRGTQGVMLMYDAGDRESFTNVRKWMKMVKEHAAAHVNVILVGHQCHSESPDEEFARAVTVEEGKALAAELGVPFLEACALTGANVEEAFMLLTTAVVARLSEDGTLAAAAAPARTAAPSAPSDMPAKCTAGPLAVAAAAAALVPAGAASAPAFELVEHDLEEAAAAAAEPAAASLTPRAAVDDKDEADVSDPPSM